MKLIQAGLWACVLILLLSPLGLAAQTANGSISGHVLDAQGEVIPGAAVAVKNPSTQATWRATTGADGAYRVLALPIGEYQVSASKSGFVTTVTQPTGLQINQTLRIDLRLAVGAVSQEVSVHANATQVQTSVPTVGGTVTGPPIKTLPLNGRDTLNLALTQPGVVPAPPSNYTMGSFTVAGGRPDGVTFLLDGGSNNALNDNNVVFNPNPDTVAEFRILENNYTAEYGRSGGGVVSVVLKSGANQLHGSAYDYLRNTSLDSNYFFSNAANQSRAALKRNQFGGTVGGPVFKNKLFFFFGYQGQRQSESQVGPAVTVYTPAEMAGDFSHAVKNGPDPKVAAFLAANPYFQPDAVQAAQAIIVPATINPVAQAYFKAGLIPSSASGTLVPQASATDNSNQYVGKLDYYASQNDRVSLTLGSNVEDQYSPFLPPANPNPNVPGYPTLFSTVERYLNLSYTKTSATLINVVQMTANRFDRAGVPATALPSTASLGTKMKSDDPTGPAELTFASGMATGFPDNGPDNNVDNGFVYSDTLTWIHGRHTVKGGFTFGANENNAFYAYQVNGIFTFSGPNGVGSGNDLADFLFGLPDSYSQYPKGVTNPRSKNYWWFLQDEWHASSSLTLTLGVRYEYNSPLTDLNGRTMNIMPGIQSKRFVNAPLGLVFPGDPGAPTGQYFPQHNNYAPRFGIAWAPSGSNFSVRGGLGVFFNSLRGESITWGNGIPPFYAAATPVFNPPSGPVTGPVPYLSDPFGSAAGGPAPNPFPSTPPPSTLDFAAEGYLPFGGVMTNPYLKTPYIYQYNVSVERQIGARMVAELNYVGNTSHDMLGYVDQDPFVLGTNTRVLNTLPGVAPGSYRNQNTIDNVAHGNYNGLISSLTRQMGESPVGQMFFTISYTWSHSLDNGSGWQERSSSVPHYDHNRFYATSDFNVGQRFVLSGGWELPGDRFFPHAPRSVVAGWTLYPILTVQSGTPLDVVAGLRSAFGTNPGPSGAGDPGLVRPNLVQGSIQTYDPHRTQTINGKTALFYFNPTDFAVPASWKTVPYPANSSLEYGSLTRNAFTGPGMTNLDLALAKTFNITEGLTSTLRVEAFNLLNHTEFLNPNTGISSGTFGQVTSTAPPRLMQVALRFDF